MILIENIVGIHGLDLVQIQDSLLHIGNDLLLFIYAGPFRILSFVFVPATAQEYEHVEFGEFGFDQVATNFEEFENPQENEQNVARCNDNEKEELTFGRQMEILVHIKVGVSWLI